MDIKIIEDFLKNRKEKKVKALQIMSIYTDTPTKLVTQSVIKDLDYAIDQLEEFLKTI